MWNVAVQALLGAASGYLTNSWAIKKLFKRYPLIGGGLLIKRRRSMSQAMGRVVAKDILNAHTLRRELSAPEVQLFLRQFVEHFLEQLPENLDQQLPGPLAEQPSFGSLRAQLSSFALDAINQSGGKILDALLQQIQLSSLLDEEELKPINDRLSAWLDSVLREQGAVGQLLCAFHLDHRQLSLAQIFGSETLLPLLQELGQLVQETPLFLQQHRGWLEERMEQLVTAEDLLPFLQELRDIVQQKSLVELFGAQNIRTLTSYLHRRLFEICSHRPELLIKMVTAFLDSIKSSELPVAKLLPPQSARKLRSFLEQALPPALERLFGWLGTQKGRLEELIEASIDQVLGQNRSIIETIQNAVLSLVRRFIGNISQRFGLADVREWQRKLERHSDFREVSQELSQQILSYFDTTPVGELVHKLQQGSKGLFNAQDIVTKLLGWWKESSYVEKMESVLANWAQRYAQKPLTHVIPDTLLTQLSERMAKAVREQLTSYLCSPQCAQLLRSQCDARLAAFCAKPVEQLSVDLPTFGQLHMPVPMSLSPDYLDTLQRRLNSEQLLPPLQSLLLEEIDGQLLRFGQHTPAHILAPLVSQPQLHQGILLTVSQLLDQKLEPLVATHLAPTFSNSLDKLSEEELRSILKKVFGEQLRPINLIGAGLGGAVGLGLGLIPLSPAAMLAIVPVYGVVGWLTNVIAINQLFAKKEHYGVIARNLDAFAKDMGAFVHQRLTEQGELHQALSGHRTLWAKAISAELQPSSLLQKFFPISPAAQKLVEHLRAPQLATQLPRMLRTRVDHFPLPSSQQAHQQLKEALPALFDHAATTLFRWSQQSSPLAETLPQSLLDQGEGWLASLAEQYLQHGRQQLSPSQWKAPLALGYQQLVDGAEQQLQSPDVRRNVLAKMQLFLLTPPIKDAICRYLSTVLQPLASVQPIDELFGKEFLKRLRKVAADRTPALADSLIKYLDEHRSEIVASAVEKYRRDNSGGGVGGFFKKIVKKVANALLGMENKMAKVVNIFLAEKLPNFLREKNDEIGELLDTFLRNYVGKVRLNEIFSAHLFLPESLAPLYQQAVSSETLLQASQLAFDALCDHVPVKDMLAKVGLSSVDDLSKVLPELLPLVHRHAITLLQQSRYPQTLRETVSLVWHQHLQPQPLARFFGSYSCQHFRQALATLEQGLVDGQACQLAIERIIGPSLAHLSQQRVEDFVPASTLELLLSRICAQLEQGKTFYPLVEQETTKQLTRLIEHADTLIPRDILVRVQSVIADSAVSLLVRSLPHLIETLKIDDITARAIQRMPLPEIKKMFYSFSGGIFRSLKADGFLLGLTPVLLFTLLAIAPQELKQRRSKTGK